MALFVGSCWPYHDGHEISRIYHSLSWYTLVTLVYTTLDYGITYILLPVGLIHKIQNLRRNTQHRSDRTAIPPARRRTPALADLRKNTTRF